jgi:ferredoxin
MPFVVIEPDKRTVELPSGAPLTDLEFECFDDSPIPFGCRAGSCGTCAIAVVDKHQSLSHPNPDEIEFLQRLSYAGPQYRLACQCRLHGDVSIRRVTEAEARQTR